MGRTEGSPPEAKADRHATRASRARDRPSGAPICMEAVRAKTIKDAAHAVGGRADKACSDVANLAGPSLRGDPSRGDARL